MNLRNTISIIIFLLFVQANAQKIIYTQQINNNDDIMLMDEKGSVKTLTDHPAKDSSPLVSPDGKKVVFTSERVGWWKIWVMDIDGKNAKQLTNSSSADYSPSWSPDGKTIVYTCTKDGNQEIYLMNSDGSNQRNITKTRGDEVMPFWAKDGYIYFSSSAEDYYQVFRCKPDGSGKVQVTFSKGDKLMPQPSPIGNKLLYYGSQDGNMEIYLFDFSSKQTARLTNHPLMDMRPRWSPDGSKIVFERGNKGNNHHVFIMDLDGENVKQLTSKYYNYTPSYIAN
jgi:TolB protein